RRRDADGVQHGPLLLHEKRRGPSPLADRLGQPRFDSTWFTSRTKVSSTPAPVFALAYDHGHRRSRKKASTSAPGRARSFSRSALFTTPNVGMSPATDRIDRAHSSMAIKVSRRVSSAPARMPWAPWPYASFSTSRTVDVPML